MHETDEVFDLVIIGAGIYGIQAARTYLSIHEKSSVVIVEASSAVGGVWSKDRVYDDFWTQTTIGIAEFSDQPLPIIPDADVHYGFFPARYLAEYLEDYIRSYRYNDESLHSRVRFNSRVTKLEKHGDWWRLQVKGSPTTIQTRRVIDASGLTSSPNIPKINGIETFNGRALHQKGFGSSNILEDDSAEKIIVLGGAKSAADLAYTCAKSGKQVSWIIRRSGSGPASYTSAAASGPYKNSNESFYTRMTSTFLASIFSPDNFLSAFLHRSGIGRKLFASIWRRITSRAWDAAGYERRDDGTNGYCNLQPDTEIFWQNDSTGINQREDFFDVIASKVKVIREDVDSASPNGLNLADGELVHADAILYGTGWDIAASYDYIDPNLARELGLCSPISSADAAETQKWKQLEQTAEKDVLSRFPMLWHPPCHRSTNPTSTPLRLYKAMVPLRDPSIVFLGKAMLGNHFRAAEVQALYACAVLDGTFQLPNREEMEEDIAKMVAWNRKRYLAKGQLGNWFWFDMVPYTDMLLDELGLQSHRQGGLRDFYQPCFAKDLKGLIGEYKARYCGGREDL